jgi:carboxypeptidase Taq
MGYAVGAIPAARAIYTGQEDAALLVAGARPRKGEIGMANRTYEAFLKRVKEVSAAQSIQAVLEWDQQTVMPKKGAAYRAEQIGLVAGVAHQQLTNRKLGQLLDKLERDGDGADGDFTVATNVREMRRLYDRAVKLPTALVQEIATATSLAGDAWTDARRASDFAQFAPHLEKLLDLKRQVADKIGWQTEPYDALMDEFEPGAKATAVQAIFDQLRRELVPLVAAIRTAPRQPDTTILERPAPIERQDAFNRSIAQAMGFDFEAGRLDVSAHPFCSGFCPHDVRMTTRYNEHGLAQSLFGVMHEAGHGLYEQGLDPAYTGTPMGTSVSLGIHESQSRLWENMVGRSRPFWEHYFPKLQAAFPSLADVSLDAWHFAINTVRPSLIRVEADEVTYGLHIMLRFDLERRMLAGKLAVRDIPQAWNDEMKRSLGIAPPDDARGCLQDIHWSLGIFGYFPTYQLGNLYAAQFARAARQALPELEAQMARGELAPLREWLRQNIHGHGKRYRANELVKVVTGQDLSPRPFIEYLQAKYKPLYGL